MKRLIISALLALGLGSNAFAETVTIEAGNGPALEPVRSISALGGLDDFDPIDERTLIVWRSPFDPYLIELAYPSVDLKFAHAIAIKSTSSRIYAKFDSVLIRGLRYPISNIYRLSRDDARELRRQT